MNGTAFSHDLLRWYDANRRDLPWRRDPVPYAVWVSEIMAQQTQIDRVVTYFERWMARFPDLQSLAAAHEEDVLKMWEGLGYYSRARNMRKAAECLVKDFGGEFPADVAAIRSLSGVGDYTAGAICSIAFGIAEPAVDANVLRVFARLLDDERPVKSSAVKNTIADCVRDIIPHDRAGDFNQALMELGALVCGKRPTCGICPVRVHCLAHERGTTGKRPVLPVAPKVIKIDMATGVLSHNGKVLIQKRRPDDVWPGLWEFPGGVIEQGESPEQALVREYMEEVELAVLPVEPLTVVSYSYTRYRITMHCFLCRAVDEGRPQPVFNEASEGRFVLPSELERFAFPAGHRRLVEYMERVGVLESL